MRNPLYFTTIGLLLSHLSPSSRITIVSFYFLVSSSTSLDEADFEFESEPVESDELLPLLESLSPLFYDFLPVVYKVLFCISFYRQLNMFCSRSLFSIIAILYYIIVILFLIVGN